MSLTAKDVMTAREVAELLDVPGSTINDWARRGLIPCTRIGRRRIFVRPLIEAMLLSGSPGTAAWEHGERASEGKRRSHSFSVLAGKRRG